MNKNMVFNMPVINELNAVEGFNPAEFLTRSGTDEPINLNVEHKKLWFRLKYPIGKITKTIVELTEQIAVVEARVYINRDDCPEHFISNAFARRFNDAADGLSCLEAAENAAIDKALDDAGFGVQYCRFADGDIPKRTGMDVTSAVSGERKQLDNTTSASPLQHGNTTPVTQLQQPDNTVTVNQAPANSNPVNETPQGAEPNTQGQQAETVNTQQPVQQGQPAQNQPAQNTPVQQYDSQTPVEDIVKMMNVEEAKNVIVPSGLHKGKTFAELAIQKPSTLEWYISSYGGNDNILRAAATVLVNAAIGQAS